MKVVFAALLLAACGGSPAPTKAFGDDCNEDADCMSGMCRQFQMMTVKKCTKACAAATQAQDCPAPSMMTCNSQGYCRF